jgi:hypothetical protein
MAKLKSKIKKIKRKITKINPSGQSPLQSLVDAGSFPATEDRSIFAKKGGYVLPKTRYQLDRILDRERMIAVDRGVHQERSDQKMRATNRVKEVPSAVIIAVEKIAVAQTTLVEAFVQLLANFQRAQQ